MARNYTKEEAIKCVVSNAKIYNKKLENESMLVVYKVDDTEFAHIEIVFVANNYQHLTGVELIDTEGNIIKFQSENFYRKCLENKLSPEEISFKEDGTTPLKLEALSAIMKIHSVTKIVGDYNDKQPFLCVDKTVGNVNVCLGVRCNDSGFYYPVSALRKDIRELSNNQSQVIAVFTKNPQENIYSRIRHVAKGVNLNNISFSEGLSDKVTLENYKPKRN